MMKLVAFVSMGSLLLANALFAQSVDLSKSCFMQYAYSELFEFNQLEKMLDHKLPSPAKLKNIIQSKWEQLLQQRNEATKYFKKSLYQCNNYCLSIYGYNPDVLDSTVRLYGPFTGTFTNNHDYVVRTDHHTWWGRNELVLTAHSGYMYSSNVGPGFGQPWNTGGSVNSVSWESYRFSFDVNKMSYQVKDKRGFAALPTREAGSCNEVDIHELMESEYFKKTYFDQALSYFNSVFKSKPYVIQGNNLYLIREITKTDVKALNVRTNKYENLNFDKANPYFIIEPYSFKLGEKNKYPHPDYRMSHLNQSHDLFLPKDRQKWICGYAKKVDGKDKDIYVGKILLDVDLLNLSNGKARLDNKQEHEYLAKLSIHDSTRSYPGPGIFTYETGNNSFVVYPLMENMETKNPGLYGFYKFDLAESFNAIFIINQTVLKNGERKEIIRPLSAAVFDPFFNDDGREVLIFMDMHNLNDRGSTNNIMCVKR